MNGEDSLKLYIESIINRARAAGLADGIFIIVCHNDRLKLAWQSEKEKFINPVDVFPDVPAEIIYEWIARANRLIDTNYSVGDALMECVTARNSGNCDAIERAEKNYEIMRNSFISNNPGFSDDTYEYAIHAGAGKAVH